MAEHQRRRIRRQDREHVRRAHPEVLHAVGRGRPDRLLHQRLLRRDRQGHAGPVQHLARRRRQRGHGREGARRPDHGPAEDRRPQGTVFAEAQERDVHAPRGHRGWHALLHAARHQHAGCCEPSGHRHPVRRSGVGVPEACGPRELRGRARHLHCGGTHRHDRHAPCAGDPACGRHPRQGQRLSGGDVDRGR